MPLFDNSLPRGQSAQFGNLQYNGMLADLCSLTTLGPIDRPKRGFMAKVLIVDDDANFLSATEKLLSILGHQVHCSPTLEDARNTLANTSFDHILLDLLLPDGSGLHLLKDLEACDDSTRATLITGHSYVSDLMGTFDSKKYNYLVKPIDLEKLKKLFEPAETEDDALANTNKYFGCLIGESPSMHALYKQIEKVVKTNANVLLMGESGTGKELFAQAIHNASKAAGDFVAINCGALSKELITSELFGHEKGAFTGAVSRKIGVFERAIQGTLFLDEITEMPLEEQTNLLRALETMTINRLGGTQPIELDSRVISATNRTEAELAEGNCMREDLYFRLAVFPMTIPPLRARKDDIPLLAQYFLNELNKSHNCQTYIEDEDLHRLAEHDWPGNVRELKHAIHRAFILAESEDGRALLPEKFGSPFSQKKQGADVQSQYGRTIEEVEKDLILTTLENLDNNKQKAAKVLGISLKTLYNRLNAYGETEV